jgi:NADPH:quinone reductase-like Zn-dependent oxidoreductase
LVKSLGAERVIDYSKEDAYAFLEAYDVVFDAVGKRKNKNFTYRKLISPGGLFLSVDYGTPKLRPEFLLTLKELMEKGEIRPVIDRCYPLEEIAEAHRYVDKGHKRGNVIITI